MKVIRHVNIRISIVVDIANVHPQSVTDLAAENACFCGHIMKDPFSVSFVISIESVAGTFILFQSKGSSAIATGSMNRMV